MASFESELSIENQLIHQLTKEKSQWTLSLPIRGARIEIPYVTITANGMNVAPHTESEN